MHHVTLIATLLSTALLSACTSNTPATHPIATSQHDSVWVAKDLELNQCQQLSAQEALNRTQQLLKQNNIDVSTAHCANDGMMRVQLCGAPQGKIGLYKIKQMGLAQAQSLGFMPVPARKYQPIKCQ